MLQVKQNFDRFISCKNTIDSIHLRLRKTEIDDGEGANGASAVVVTRAVEEVRLRYSYGVHCISPHALMLSARAVLITCSSHKHTYYQPVTKYTTVCIKYYAFAQARANKSSREANDLALTLASLSGCWRRNTRQIPLY